MLSIDRKYVHDSKWTLLGKSLLSDSRLDPSQLLGKKLGQTWTKKSSLKATYFTSPTLMARHQISVTNITFWRMILSNSGGVWRSVTNITICYIIHNVYEILWCWWPIGMSLTCSRMSPSRISWAESSARNPEIKLFGRIEIP